MSRYLLCLLFALPLACSDYSMLQREDVAGAGGSDGYPFLDPDADDLGEDPTGEGGDDAWVDGKEGDTAWSEPEDACEKAVNITGYLDQFQLEDDGRVLFCHSSSGNNFVMVESDIDSCLSHLDHKYDIFPGTLCDS